MGRLPAALLLISLTLPPAVGAEQPSEDGSYCNDPQSASTWLELAAKYYPDDDVQRLHALRIGLCQKIEDGTVDQDHAIQLFEVERTKTYQRLKKEEREHLLEMLAETGEPQTEEERRHVRGIKTVLAEHRRMLARLLNEH